MNLPWQRNSPPIQPADGSRWLVAIRDSENGLHIEAVTVQVADWHTHLIGNVGVLCYVEWQDCEWVCPIDAVAATIPEGGPKP